MTGRQLKNRRTKLGWTQVQAARTCGVTMRTWARWEANENRVPETVGMVMSSRVDEISAKKRKR